MRGLAARESDKWLEETGPDHRTEQYPVGISKDGGTWRGPNAAAWMKRLLRGAPPPWEPLGHGRDVLDINIPRQRLKARIRQIAENTGAAGSVVDAAVGGQHRGPELPRPEALKKPGLRVSAPQLIQPEAAGTPKGATP